MAWKSSRDYNPVFKFEAGLSIEGAFLGTRKVDKIDSKLHSVKLDNGIVYDLYGCGGLDSQLANIPYGEKIKILYNGKRKATVKIDGKDTKKEVHDYIVYQEVAE